MSTDGKPTAIYLVQQGLSVHSLKLEEGSSEEYWPSPPPSGYRLGEEAWADFQVKFRLPAFIDTLNVRALLERDIEHAVLQFDETVDLPKLSVLIRQLKALSLAPVGSSLPDDLHPRVFELLANEAFRDKKFGNGRLSAHNSCRDYIEKLETVTPNLKRWANASHERKAADLAPYTPRPGTGESAEQIFISVLYNFWTTRLNRTVTNWDDGDGNAAEFTRFVTVCLDIVGVRYAGKSPTISAVRHRVRRVLREIKLAQKAGLHSSVLARRCNPEWNNSAIDE